MRALRGDRSQAEFARILDVSQSVLSERLENPEYSGPNVSTLVKVANKLQMGLLVRFVSFPELLERTEDVSEKSLKVETITESVTRLTASQSIQVPFSNIWRARIRVAPRAPLISYDTASHVRPVTFWTDAGENRWQTVRVPQILQIFQSSEAQSTASTMPTIAKSGSRPLMFPSNSPS
jgi:transcriptional regulator with XRE-family HTH domain